MTRKKEKFQAVHPGEVRMYVCGPTVYHFLHVGNFFGPILFNMVRNWFEESGYKVTYVYNYTDVEDRIFEKSIAEKVHFQEITERYIREFEKDYTSLKLGAHTHNPRVTEYIPQIVKFIEDLVDKGKAYELNGDVYFNVHEFPEYGGLSNKKIEELEAGHRVEENNQKKHPTDFALWKAAKPGEPTWESPWGLGRPGWHIECSCMSQALLGETIDIHGGGLDLMFPHHENEIAQSEAHTGVKYVNYWMHNNMLNFGDQKMSKSLGNVMTGRSFMERYNGEILKYLILSSHYRSVIDFSEQQVARAVTSLAKFYSALALANKISKYEVADVPCPSDFKKISDKSHEGIATAMNDDFNTPEVMARGFEMVRGFNAVCKKPGKIKPPMKAVAIEFLKYFSYCSKITALFAEPAAEFLVTLDDMLLLEKKVERQFVDGLVQERFEARANKDYKRGDELRDQLAELGISVQDGVDGTTWEVEK